MRIIDIEEIRPKQYEANIERYGESGCIICGKPLNDREYIQGDCWLHWLPNGEVTDSDELDGKIPDCADLGWWQIGRTCYKHFLKAAHEKPAREWLIENGYNE